MRDVADHAIYAAAMKSHACALRGQRAGGASDEDATDIRNETASRSGAGKGASVGRLMVSHQ